MPFLKMLEYTSRLQVRLRGVSGVRGMQGDVQARTTWPDVQSIIS